MENHLKATNSEQHIFHRSYNDLDAIEPKNTSMHYSKTTPANFDSNIIYTTLPRNYKHTIKNNDAKNESYREKEEKFHKRCNQCCQNGVNLATRFAPKSTKNFKSTPELTNLNKIIVKNRVKELEDYKMVKIEQNHDYVFLKNYDLKRLENNENEEFNQKQGIFFLNF